jgi:predicted metal-dependent enzyme (double-stranded beta helix superfamily)
MIPKIKTVKDLARNMDLGPGYDGFIELVKSIELSDEEIRKHAVWNEEHYTRNCLYSTPSIEVLLMCWMPGQHTPVHDYSFKEGWTKILKGQLLLEYFRVDENGLVKTDEQVLKEGDIAYLRDDLGVHRFINESNENTVSLHIYAERIRKWNIFDDKGKAHEVIPEIDSKTEYC